MNRNFKWLYAVVAAFALQISLGTGAAYSHDRGSCGRRMPNLDARAFCDTHISVPRRIPKVCFKTGRLDAVRRACSRFGFSGEPHYLVVRMAANGAVRSIHLIETKTRREAVTAYPYGIAFGAPQNGDREVQLRAEDLGGFLGGTPPPGSTRHARRRPPSRRPPSGHPPPEEYATGLPIGWNPSTGATPGQCFNYTISTPSNNTQQASFSSQDAASSTAAQINVSATVKTSYDLFKAKDKFSFSDQWQSSSFSSNQYYNFYSLYTLDSTVDRNNPLTAQGAGAGTSFGTLCGSQYMSAVPVGMVATISINYGSSSQSTQTAISDSLKASYDLTSVKTAVSTANEDTESESYFTFSMISYGGGNDATAALINGFDTTDPSSGEAYYSECAQGNTDACGQFSSNMGVGAASALESLNSLVADLATETNPDLSFFDSFPSGVTGADIPGLVTTPVPVLTSDVLEPYADQLSQYVTLLNQIATLDNRVGAIDDLLTATPALNPTPLLDLTSYLGDLDRTYANDRTTLLGNLQNCLAATSSNVTSVCEPIIDNVSDNANDYYAEGRPRADFLAQQNSVALQYTSSVGPIGATPLPLDVMYVDALPSSLSTLSGDAALVGILDRTLSPPPTADVELLPLDHGKPISTDNVSIKANDGTFTAAALGGGVAAELILFPGASISGAGPCAPTIDEPCAIDYIYPAGTETFPETHEVLNRSIQNLF